MADHVEEAWHEMIDGRDKEIAALRAALAEQDDFILKFSDTRSRNGDWACAQCKPHSDMLKEGFVCGYHRAEARATARQLANGPHDHDHLEVLK